MKQCYFDYINGKFIYEFNTHDFIKRYLHFNGVDKHALGIRIFHTCKILKSYITAIGRCQLHQKQWFHRTQ